MNLADTFATLPDDRSERWRLIRAFIGVWHGELTAADGIAESKIRWAGKHLGVALPLALGEAYAMFGQKEEIALAFEEFLPPRRLRLDRGLLVFWELDDANAWGIRVQDLHLEDPPVFVVERLTKKLGEAPAPALVAPDSSLSRFFAWKVLEQTIQSSRYHNLISGSEARRYEPELRRHLEHLAFAETAAPPPASRLYGGDDVLVLSTAEGIWLGAPNLEAYQRAMILLSAMPWELSEEEAFRGTFREQCRDLAETEKFLLDATAAERAARHKRVAAEEEEEDDAPEIVAPGLHPRLQEIVERGLGPYARMLPRAAIARFRHEIEFLVETFPGIEPWLDAIGAPREALDMGALMSSGNEAMPEPPEGLTDKQRALIEEAKASGMVERMARAMMSRQMPEASDIELAMFSTASEGVGRFFSNMPRIPPPRDAETAERELVRFVNRALASLFAGVMGMAMKFQKTVYAKDLTAQNYLWASLVFKKVGHPGRDAKTFLIYYMDDYDIDEAADELGLSAAEEYENHAGYLDRLAGGIAEEVTRLNLPPEHIDTPSREALPWIHSLVAKELLKKKPPRDE